MGMTVLLQVSGDKHVSDMFTAFEKRVGAPKAAFLEIAELIAKDNDRTYGRGPQLAPATVASKQRLGRNPGRLDATGEMKHQVTTVEGGVREVTDSVLVFGTTKFYARFAQYGTKSTPTHTGEVKRRVIRFTPTAKLEAVEILRRHIMGGDL